MTFTVDHSMTKIDKVGGDEGGEGKASGEGEAGVEGVVGTYTVCPSVLNMLMMHLKMKVHVIINQLNLQHLPLNYNNN